MPTSDSEDFESADEGHNTNEKKGRKHRTSSSNYSDKALETDAQVKIPASLPTSKDTDKDQSDGWDDFDIEESDPIDEPVDTKMQEKMNAVSKTGPSKKPEEKSDDTGWEDFGEWGNDNATKDPKKPQTYKDIEEVTSRLTAITTAPTSNTGWDSAANSGTSGWGPVPTSGNTGWGWGWGGVDSLLSTATAGISSLTNQVSQGITNVLETGIGVPDPEEMARRTVQVNENKPENAPESNNPESNVESKNEGKSSGDTAYNTFGNIWKFVGDTGSKVIAGGLDTLETIGRKTMEVLQEGDPQLARKRALLGLDTDRPNLSQVLREAKEKGEEDDRIKEEKREAKEVHYESLFDDFEGLVHLEALEMLSKHVNMKIEEKLRDTSDKQEMKETLQQVAELCELPNEDDEEEEDYKFGFPDETEERIKTLPKGEAFHERLQKATRDLGVKLQLQPLVKHYEDTLTWLSDPNSEATVKSVRIRAISALAQCTALCVQLYHKAGEGLMARQRRATADEADALTQMTAVLTKHTSELATLFTEKIDSVADPVTVDEAKDYITHVFLEAGNSSTYIQTAFLLTQPIVQIGAI